MKYEILLMDLDDTLLDFGANEEQALKKLFTGFGHSYNDRILSVYNTVNKTLWAAYEKGDISLRQVLDHRFSDTMEQLGLYINGALWEEEYRRLLALGFQAFLIIVCVAIYAVLVQNIATEEDIIMAIWSCVGYTVLLCFTLFKTGSLAKAVFQAH